MGADFNKLCTLALCLSFNLINTRLCCGQAASSPTFTLYKNDTDLPGPSTFFNESLEQGVFAFEFRTLVEDAVVLYQDSEGFGDFFALSLRAGKLYVSFTIGPESQEDALVSHATLNDFEWHSVRIVRNISITSVNVDHNRTKSFQTNGKLSEFVTKLQLGGFPPDSYQNTYKVSSQNTLRLYVGSFTAGRHGFFTACVRNVRYGVNESTTHHIQDITSRRSYMKDGCHLTYCQNTEPYCKNHGKCSQRASNSTAICDCSYTGYTGKNCDEDIDECLDSPSVCPSDTRQCQNNPGSFSCECTTGYREDEHRNCTDVDECSEMSSPPCHNHAKCSNSEGSYFCHCTKGYSGDGKTCTDVDECTSLLGDCHQFANCTNTEGSYICQCKSGYTGNGTTNCSAIDRCLEPDNPCHGNASCTNTAEESYLCECLPGFAGDGENNCTAIDRCYAEHDSLCHENATCTNTEDSYVCECLPGFTGDGENNCTDVDKCSEPNVTCHPQANCINAKGSYSCECKPGYAGNGSTYCTDINECETYTGVCHANATCANLVGSYTCDCKAGYLGDGYSNCTRNHCDNQPCFPGLACTVKDDGYVCEECPKLFEGDGRDCTLHKTQETRTFNLSMKLAHEPWNVELMNRSSTTFRTYSHKVANEIRKAYTNHAEFAYAIVTGFRKGSVVAEVQLVFTKHVENYLEPLERAMMQTKFAVIIRETNEIPNDHGDDDEKKRVEDEGDNKKILGLNKTTFIGIVVAASVVVIIVVLLAVVCIYQRKTKQRKATITAI